MGPEFRPLFLCLEICACPVSSISLRPKVFLGSRYAPRTAFARKSYSNNVMIDSPKFEFHVARAVRQKYGFDEELFSWTGNVLFANLAASRRFATKVNEVRRAHQHPELAMNPGALNAMGLIDEVLHALIEQYRRERDPKAMSDALIWFES